MKLLLLIPLLIALIFISGCSQPNYDTSLVLDNLAVKWFGHSSFQIKYDSNTIYLDPFVLPQNPDRADIILLSHDHFDHCDPEKVRKIQVNTGDHYKRTSIIGTKSCILKLVGRTNEIKPPEWFNFSSIDIKVDAVKAYNINKEYHPEGSGVGFLITIKNKKLYFASDTDFIPEMSALKNQSVDVAFLPIGGKYTMDVEEAAKAALEIRPKIVVPMHYNSDKYGIPDIQTNPEKLKQLLEGSGIEVKILKPLA